MSPDYNSFFNLVFRNDGLGVRQALLDGADPNFEHPIAGHTPLQIACEGNAEAAAIALLQGGANPNQRFTKSSLVTGAVYKDRVALMYAKSEPLIRILVGAGADVNLADSEGWTSLSLAAQGGFPEVFEILLSHGANKDLQGEVLEKYGSLSGLVDDRVEFLEEQLRKAGASPRLVGLLSETRRLRALLQR
jgi:ankyrin repeat protein